MPYCGPADLPTLVLRVQPASGNVVGGRYSALAGIRRAKAGGGDPDKQEGDCRVHGPDPAVVDLRSDTVTRPTPAMRRAMAEAPVGDDVFGDDPTVNLLQERVAAALGKAAALFVPSGTMANEIAIRVHAQPGDEIIAQADSHIYHYETGGPAALSGCSMRLLAGARGMFDGDAVRAAVRAPDSHLAHSALVLIENTHNRGGGSVWPLADVAEVCATARDLGLKLHLDGARLWNACIRTGHAPADYARHFDTVSVCFSKGLGAPIGSALAGSVAAIQRAHRFRKMFGGGMRQAGIIAAGALYALEHHIPRLAEDHARAERLATALAELPGVRLDPPTVESNIVIFELDPGAGTARDFVARLREHAVWMLAIAPQRVRAVTHLDVSDAGLDRAIRTVREVSAARTARPPTASP
ncbi:MAG TPA: GntG family PLP-dependent aldolase [Phycisphaerae bacterium]|nr:GntG family PLP-dependent aldolase [Phycisphaerae bacterium]HNU46674.1 GntG family PLP-dependent aldolase [Phycisphaerae bacterium]